jgi:hypothetical protein
MSVNFTIDLRTVKAHGPKAHKPRRFRPAHAVRHAEFMLDPPLGLESAQRHSPAQKRGLRYQEQVLETLDGLGAFKLFVPSPWIEFQDYHGRRICQPDGLGFHETAHGPVATVFEIKLSHTIMAYWQLRRLYEPVVRHMFPEYEVRVCEVTRTFDPALPWPEDIALCLELDSVKQLTDAFGVIQWRT